MSCILNIPQSILYVSFIIVTIILQIFSDKASLGEIKSSSTSMSLGDMVALCVGNLGENMALRRAAYVRAHAESQLSFYVHPSGTYDKKGCDFILWMWRQDWLIVFELKTVMETGEIVRYGF